jgi:adenosylcobinamide-GDP ribazoletransferase
MTLRGVLKDIAAAFQFLTRLPLPRLEYESDALSRSAKFFPLVGVAIGLLMVVVFGLLTPHLPVMIAALLAVLASILATGALHEDGFADAADAFGGGWNRDQVLAIMKDSRIGTYGALAVVSSLSLRTLLFGSLPGGRVAAYVISAQVLSRWTILPLGRVLGSARQKASEESTQEASQGARLAGRISPASLVAGTLIAAAFAAYLLKSSILAPALCTLAITALSGLYYRFRIDGITGDCFGATIQLTDIAVCLCGVWKR